MNFTEYPIVYPPVHPGTERTYIRFYSGKPDLDAIFLQNAGPETPLRIFVTDTNIAFLEDTRVFFSHFIPERILSSRKFDESDGKSNCVFKNSNSKNLLVVLKAGEAFKDIESVLSIIKAALDFNAQRSAVFIGIGGGVICDMTAFAASIFKRGASCELVPTTLLSMCDAAIGGKTGCDFDEYKNMIGAFFPAQKIHIAPNFVKTLDEEQFQSGLAEVVKTFLLYNENSYREFKAEREKVLSRDEKTIEKFITECAKAKAAVVEKDLTEKNIRMHLNLGHTFGHALETKSGLGRISHGNAVAWGIGRACELSANLGLCTKAFKDDVLETLEDYGWCVEKLPEVIKTSENGKGKTDDEIAKILFEAMKKDKKNKDSSVRFVLQEGFEKNVVAQVKESEVLKVLS